jgi:hypothetical protein
MDGENAEQEGWLRRGMQLMAHMYDRQKPSAVVLWLLLLLSCCTEKHAKAADAAW